MQRHFCKETSRLWHVVESDATVEPHRPDIYQGYRRIRSIEEKGEAAVDEGIEPEFIGIVNYCVIALIQLKLAPGSQITKSEALSLYDESISAATKLMTDKNHDYDEAWRHMRVSSFTDIILRNCFEQKRLKIMMEKLL